MEERLAVILRYLASGDSQQLLGWAHRTGKATISKIIKETNNAIWEVLRGLFEATSRSSKLESHIQRILEIFGTFHIVSGLLTGNILPLNTVNYLGRR